ncbi:hypothetical protein RvY_02064 [Ramazzottius varieornatus]|uniref:SKP1 component POZ domain-containing protein n=1 Tax=Ramazzottius varieornatus TaxID=947166 RepID=A0A1D1ULU0_RAMVA|nr:hypothetical protein RvY_02064 [Ramazzottius varieornatus]
MYGMSSHLTSWDKEVVCSWSLKSFYIMAMGKKKRTPVEPIIEEDAIPEFVRPPQSKIIVKVKCSDGQIFSMKATTARQSRIIGELLDELEAAGGDLTKHSFPLPKTIKSRIFRKILPWLQHHAKDTDAESWQLTKRESDIPEWDQAFMQSAKDENVFYDMMNATDTLDIKVLRSLCCKCVAHSLRGKTVEQMRLMLGIESDFTPEEEERNKLEIDFLTRRMNRLL